MNRFLFLLASLLVANALSCAVKEKTAPPAAKEPNPDCPRINLAPHYEVDPSWPQRPANMPWGDVPGIAVDRHDQAWVFTRTKSARASVHR
jgi:hypothetical protein